MLRNVNVSSRLFTDELNTMPGNTDRNAQNIRLTQAKFNNDTKHEQGSEFFFSFFVITSESFRKKSKPFRKTSSSSRNENKPMRKISKAFRITEKGFRQFSNSFQIIQHSLRDIKNSTRKIEQAFEKS